MKNKFQRAHLYGITFCLACCSLMYELLIAEAVASLATNTVIWYSVTIGLYLISLGFGVMSCRRIFTDGEKHLEDLYRVELGISFFGFISILALYCAHAVMGYFWLRGAYGLSVGLFFGAAFFLIIVIGFLSGLELPLLMNLGKRFFPEDASLNRILASDYFGSLAAGLIFPLILIPRFQLIQISFLISSVNLLIALYLLGRNFQIENLSPKSVMDKLFAMKGTFLFCFIFLIALLNHQSINQYFLKKYYYYPVAEKDFLSLFKGMKKFPKVRREVSSYQRIDLVQLLPTAENVFAQQILSTYKNHSSKQGAYDQYALFINGAFQFYAMTEEFYHEYFAHIPVILNGKVPKKVLVLGAGDGLLSRELRKYQEIESITMVEIDKKIIAMAKNDPVLSQLNEHSLDDSRINIIIQDAYSFVRQCSDAYDAVYLDFPEPSDYNLSKIYSREFYEMLASCLTENGYIAIDAPSVKTFQTKQQDIFAQDSSYYLQTLFKAGFEKLVSFETEMEKDNTQAVKLISQVVGDAETLTVRERDVNDEKVKTIKGTQNIVRKILSDFIEDHKQRFIFAKKKNKLEDLSYIDFGLDLNTLNEKRYSLAIDYYSPKDGFKADLSKVNSILRPTLPNPRFWWRLKFPY